MDDRNLTYKASGQCSSEKLRSHDNRDGCWCAHKHVFGTGHLRGGRGARGSVPADGGDGPQWRGMPSDVPQGSPACHRTPANTSGNLGHTSDKDDVLAQEEFAFMEQVTQLRCGW